MQDGEVVGGVRHGLARRMRRAASSSAGLLSSSSASDSISSLDRIHVQSSERTVFGGVVTVLIVLAVSAYAITQFYWLATTGQMKSTIPTLEDNEHVSVPVCSGCASLSRDFDAISCQLYSDKGEQLPMRRVNANQTVWGLKIPTWVRPVRRSNTWANWTFVYGCSIVAEWDTHLPTMHTCAMLVNRSHAFLEPPVFIGLTKIDNTVDGPRVAIGSAFVRVSPVLDRMYGWMLSTTMLRFVTSVPPTPNFLNEIIFGNREDGADYATSKSTHWQYFPAGEYAPVSCTSVIAADGKWPSGGVGIDCVLMAYLLGGNRVDTVFSSTRSIMATVGVVGGFASGFIFLAKGCFGLLTCMRTRALNKIADKSPEPAVTAISLDVIPSCDEHSPQASPRESIAGLTSSGMFSSDGVAVTP